MVTDKDILINRVKYLYMLNQIFHDNQINNHINHLKKCGEMQKINNLEECNNHMKQSTIYLRVIKKLTNINI